MRGPFELRTPLRSLKPGTYTAQVNIVDELGRKFRFERAQIAVRTGDSPARTTP
jgi:hypothetical protein